MNVLNLILFAGSLLIRFAGCVEKHAVYMPQDDVLALSQLYASGSSPVLKIVVLQDKSGSTSENLTPQLTLAEIEYFVGLIAINGGEFAIAFIDERSDEPMHRLFLDPPPALPEEPEKATNPFSDRKSRSEFREKQAQYELDRREWEARSRDAIDRFKREVEDRLEAPSNAQKTDVLGALLRAEYFLNEPEAASQESFKVLIVISDAQDNVAAHAIPSTLDSGAQLILINGTDSLGALEVLKPLRFESISSAMRYLRDIV